MKHGLLLFFNHPYPKVRLFLQQFYHDRFQQIHTLTPPETAAENIDRDVTYFYQGAYNFGGAFSYLIHRPEIFAGLDWITVLHDDVILHPSFPGLIEDKLFGPECLCPPIDPVFSEVGWPWDARMIARARFPVNPVLGDGNEGALREMRELYQQAPGARGAPFTTLKLPSCDLLRFGAFGALARTLLRAQRSLSFDFRVPLFKANSDFFMVRQDKLGAFCHASGLLTRCGLFAETAVPTALRWITEKRDEFLPAQLDWSRRTDEANRKHFQIESLSDIVPHFERHPGTIALHPVKFSRLLRK